MIRIFLTPAWILLLGTVLGARPLIAKEIPTIIEELPVVRMEIYQEVADLQAGSTVEMVDAAMLVREKLFPYVILLEAALDKKDQETIRKEMERDLESIYRDAQIRGHADGWGGTIVKVEAAWSVVTHIEARISYAVWQLMQDSPTFDFQQWSERWRLQQPAVFPRAEPVE